MAAGYLHYNVVAKKLARRLQALGAAPCMELGLGDDQHPQGYEAALDPWLAALWAMLRKKCLLPTGVSEVRVAELHASTACDLSRIIRHLHFHKAALSFWLAACEPRCGRVTCWHLGYQKRGQEISTYWP